MPYATRKRNSFGARPLPPLAGGRRRPAPGRGRGMAGIGYWGEDFVNSAVDTFVDASTAVATGGTSLLLPDEYKPSAIIHDPRGFLSSGGDTVKKVIKTAGTVIGKGAVAAGQGLTGGARTAPPPAAAAPAFNYTPWLIGGGAALVLLLALRRKKKT